MLGAQRGGMNLGVWERLPSSPPEGRLCLRAPPHIRGCWDPDPRPGSHAWSSGLCSSSQESWGRGALSTPPFWAALRLPGASTHPCQRGWGGAVLGADRPMLFLQAEEGAPGSRGEGRGPLTARAGAWLPATSLRDRGPDFWSPWWPLVATQPDFLHPCPSCPGPSWSLKTRV